MHPTWTESIQVNVSHCCVSLDTGLRMNYIYI